MKHSDLKIGMKVKRVTAFDNNFYASTKGNISVVSGIFDHVFQVEGYPAQNWLADYFEPVIEEQEKSITISKDKKYKTRCGYPVRIICTDLKNEATPVLAAVETFHGHEILSLHTSKGICAGASDFDLIELTPYADFKKDDKVMVSDDGTHWFPYHFAKVMCGLPYTFYGGKTSFSSDESDIIDWNYCRKPTQEEFEGD